MAVIVLAIFIVFPYIKITRLGEEQHEQGHPPLSGQPGRVLGGARLFVIFPLYIAFMTAATPFEDFPPSSVGCPSDPTSRHLSTSGTRCRWHATS